MRLHFSLRFIKHRDISHYGEKEFGIRLRFPLQRLKRQMARCCAQGKGFYNQRIRIHSSVWHTGSTICYQKIPLFQFPEDHQSNITNSVNLRVGTIQEIKISISMVSNSAAWKYAYGCKYTVNKCTSTIMISSMI